jgi:hypothetical protein
MHWLRAPLLAFVTTVAVIAATVETVEGQIRADPDMLALVPAELLAELKNDPFDYFRFVNRPWIARVCEIVHSEFATLPVVQLHGDAHVEQFAVSADAWGLEDFDDSARGPAVVDIVRFLGSVELVLQQRGWTRHRAALFDRFFAGYRRGLSEPGYQPPTPDLVRHLRADAPASRTAFLAWAETKMEPMADGSIKAVVTGMDTFSLLMRKERPELAPDYFRVVRAGWLRMGVGSAVSKKVLIRIQGSTPDPGDDELLEVKSVGFLGGLSCLDVPRAATVIRIIDGTRLLGRMKPTILAAGPDLRLPDVVVREDQLGSWWIHSWDPTYRELHTTDLKSVVDLDAIVFDAGVQLGGGSLQEKNGAEGVAARKQAWTSIGAQQARLRKTALALVAELLRGWQELRAGGSGR